MATLSMLHAVDPREDLLKKIGNLDHIDVFSNHVLVATYVRPTTTKSGLILTAQTRKEDEYQGKIGLVIKKGPLAFEDDDRNHFKGQNVEIGEWIAYRQSDGWQLKLGGSVKNFEEADGGWHCRMLQDIDIKMRVSHPDALL